MVFFGVVFVGSGGVKAKGHVICCGDLCCILCVLVEKIRVFLFGWRSALGMRRVALASA